MPKSIVLSKKRLVTLMCAFSALIKKRQSRAEKIQAELKLLEWHKLANDAALKVFPLI